MVRRMCHATVGTIGREIDGLLTRSGIVLIATLDTACRVQAVMSRVIKTLAAVALRQAVWVSFRPFDPNLVFAQGTDTEDVLIPATWLGGQVEEKEIRCIRTNAAPALVFWEKYTPNRVPHTSQLIANGRDTHNG